jgi:hypothetical protein
VRPAADLQLRYSHGVQHVWTASYDTEPHLLRPPSLVDGSSAYFNTAVPMLGLVSGIKSWTTVANPAALKLPRPMERTPPFGPVTVSVPVVPETACGYDAPTTGPPLPLHLDHS